MTTIGKNRKKRSTNSISKLIAEYFKDQPVLKAWLFGSFARGEQTEDLKEILGRNIDLVTEESLADFARPSVEKDKKLIYERAYQR